MATPDWSLQRDLIRLLVKRVEVDHDKINVVFRVAPPPASLPPGPRQGRSLQDCWRGDLTTAGEYLHAPVCSGVEEARSGARLGSRLVIYADDLVILCRHGNAEARLHHLREIMGKRKPKLKH